jgi:hypothetical protein
LGVFVHRRRNWSKIVLRFTLLLVLAAAGVSAMSYIAMRRTPDWYQPDTKTDAQRNRIAARLENMLALLVDWGQRNHLQHAAPNVSNTQQVQALLSHKADESFPISFTDDELNALFNKWANTKNRREWFEQYVDNPQLVIRGKQLIIVGKVRAMDMVISLIFEPRLEPDGQMNLRLVHVLGGVLPLPDALWSGQKWAIEKVLREKLPLYQQDANISADGIANGDAASAAMNQLLLDTITYKPTNAVVFVPIDWQQLTKSLPVKITALSIHDHTVEMTAEPMTSKERGILLQRLKTSGSVPGQ